MAVRSPLNTSVAGLSAANSYITLDRAEAILGDLYEREIASTFGQDVIESALVTATYVLDELNWAGRSAAQDQVLAWPRDITIPINHPGNNTGRTITIDGTTPVDIEIAAAELMHHLLVNPGITTDTGGIFNNSSLSVGSIELTGIVAADRIPSHVRRRVRKYLDGIPANAVFVGA